MSRLRVGIPVAQTRYPPQTSVHRIWGHGIALLEDHVRVHVLEPGGRRARLRRPDVWLTDGHQGPIPVRAPVVAHLHEAPWDDPVASTGLTQEFIEQYRPTSARAAAQAAHIITASEATRRQIVAAYDVPAERVHVVHDGVDLITHHPQLRGGHDLVREAGSNSPYVLFVGTVHPRKNLPALREAMRRLTDEGFEHRLVLVAGPAADRLDSDQLLVDATAQIGGKAVINLAGVDDHDLARLMADASALCLPSHFEGFGMPVAEAMACGTPVVVSDRGSLPEVAGDAGVITTVDADSIAAGLRRVLSDAEEAGRLGEAGHRRAQGFSWAAMAAGWADVLTAAAEESAR